MCVYLRVKQWIDHQRGLSRGEELGEGYETSSDWGCGRRVYTCKGGGGPGDGDSGIGKEIGSCGLRVGEKWGWDSKNVTSSHVWWRQVRGSRQRYSFWAWEYPRKSHITNQGDNLSKQVKSCTKQTHPNTRGGMSFLELEPISLRNRNLRYQRISCDYFEYGMSQSLSFLGWRQENRISLCKTIDYILLIRKQVVSTTSHHKC